MADSRSRRPTSPSRRRVAGTRKRSTRGDSAPEQTVSTEGSQTPAGEDSPNDGDRATTERIESSPAGDQDSRNGTEVVGEPGTVEVDSAADDAAESDTAESDTADSDTTELEADEARRTLVVRDGLVGLSEPEEDSETESRSETGYDGEGSAASDSGTDGTDQSQTTPIGSRRAALSVRAWLLPVMAVLVVIFAGLAFWFQTNVSALRNDGAAANQALVESAATSEVNGQIKTAVEKVFSYDYANTGKTEKAAKELLVGTAVDEYNQLFATVKEQAPKQKLVVTTTVKKSAVSYLQGDRARLLLFVDQHAARDGEPGNIVPAQITVGAEKKGDQWQINEIIQR